MALDYNEVVNEHRRLAILQALEAAPAYTLHEIDLKNALARNGQRVGYDALHADLQWLHEQGLVLAKHPEGFWFATLTAKGGDVREGLTLLPGVARPEPV